MPAIVLTHPTAGAGSTPLSVNLPGNLLWVDEYGWSAITSVKKYTGEGALVVDQWPKLAGRPITLQGEQDRAWCDRGLLNTLRAWSSQFGADNQPLVLTLAINGATYDVIFDHEQSSPIQADPLTDLLGGPGRYTVHNDAGQVIVDVDVDYFNPQPTDPFVVTLRFTEM